MSERAHKSRDTWAEKGVFTEAPDRYTVGHRWKGMMTCAMKEERLPREMTHLLASCSFAKSASSSCEGGSLGIKVVTVVGLLLWLKTSLLLLLLMEPLLLLLLLLLHSLTLRPAAFAVNDNRREQC
jgi:hypothetical protein